MSKALKLQAQRDQQEAVAFYARFCTPEIDQKLEDCLVGMLSAEKTEWIEEEDGTGEKGGKKKVPVQRPNFEVQEKAVARISHFRDKYTEYTVGKAIERIEMKTQDVDPPEVKMAKLMASPSGFLALFREMMTVMKETPEGKQHLWEIAQDSMTALEASEEGKALMGVAA